MTASAARPAERLAAAGPSPDGAPRELIVRGPNWLGDLVMATPGFRALREGLPGTRITLLVRRGLEELMTGSPLFDEVLVMDSHRRGARAMWREARALRRARRYDVGLCIPDSWSSALFMRALGVRRIVGYGRGGRAALLHEAVPTPAEWGSDRMVARERFVLGLVRALGVRELGTDLELHFDAQDAARASAVLAEAGLGDGSGPLVLLAPGASYGPAKQWPAEHYARVGERLLRAGHRVALIGAPGERALCDRIAGELRGGAANLAGRLALGPLKALIARAALVVCNDSGARHLAAAFAVPSLVFFGPTAVAKTSLNLETVRVLEREDACRPCYARRCPIDHRCLRGIEPEPVTELALQILGAP